MGQVNYNDALGKDQNKINVIEAVYVGKLIVSAYLKAGKRDLAQQYVQKAHSMFGQYQTGHMKKARINQLFSSFDNFAKTNGLDSK